MSLELHNLESRLSKGLMSLKDQYGSGVMEGRAKSREYHHRTFLQGNSRKFFTAGYFSVESFMVLVCLTASLLILPLILPPLPPPPFLLLLLPICILALLMILAFMPSDIRDIASSYA